MTQFYAVTSLNFESHVARTFFVSPHVTFMTNSHGNLCITSPIYDHQEDCLDDMEGYFHAVKDMFADVYPDFNVEFERMDNSLFYPKSPIGACGSQFDEDAMLLMRLVETTPVRKTIMSSSIFIKAH